MYTYVHFLHLSSMNLVQNVLVGIANHQGMFI